MKRFGIMWNNETRFVLKANLPSNEIGEDFILLDSKNTKTHELNPVAKDIWTALDKEISLLDLTTHLLSKYDVEKELLEKDITHFLQELKKRDLINIYE
jgi:hypothetical protein